MELVKLLELPPTPLVRPGYCLVAYYWSDTGLWTEKTYSGPETDCAANAPADSVAMPYETNPHAKRMVDGALVDYQPPAPEPASDYQWNAERGEWELTPEALALDMKDKSARWQIDDLEYKQNRAVRENIVNVESLEARQRLEETQAQIELLRQDLKPITREQYAQQREKQKLNETFKRFGITPPVDRLRGDT